MVERHIYTNRLAKEKSPYLLQHAHNPVDWYPWGKEAFEAAEEQDKPIFLSIGYATCHWCHVMEEESFENADIAELMNRAFINIKVDREELPEIDSIYMEFAQSMMSGAAGWPLNVILTPQLQPFFAATYLPPHNAHGLMGLAELIKKIHEVWIGEERENVIDQASKIVEVFTKSVHTHGDQIPSKDLIHDSAELFFKMTDPIYGGIKGVPKFPIGYHCNLYLRCFSAIKDNRALFIVERTLDMMHRGGIYDHLGGGFSRYSVDEQWLVPHFEKMLYDNALLADAYREASLVTKNSLYKQVSEEIFAYILRDMTHPEGAFYSAEDADSEGHEGYFYTWTYDEVVRLLGHEESRQFCQFYSITPEGNFEGRNILHTPSSLIEFAEKTGQDPSALEQRLGLQRQILWKARTSRVHPFKDDKILCSWNGLAIYSLACAGCSFGNRQYLMAAQRAAAFIQKYMWKDGGLFRRWREGEALYAAGLDDYAFLIRGLLALFEADCGYQWLVWAIELTRVLEEQFKSHEGAFYQTNGRDEHIILRNCQFSDGAEPSGNAVHCENLLKLHQITQESSFLESAIDVLQAVKKYIDSYPPGYSYHLMNLCRYYYAHTPAIVVALNAEEEHRAELSRIINEKFIPSKCLIWARLKDQEHFPVIPLLTGKEPIDGKTTLYVCYDGACKQPINDFDEMAHTLALL